MLHIAGVGRNAAFDGTLKTAISMGRCQQLQTQDCSRDNTFQLLHGWFSWLSGR